MLAPELIWRFSKIAIYSAPRGVGHVPQLPNIHVTTRIPQTHTMPNQVLALPASSQPPPSTHPPAELPPAAFEFDSQPPLFPKPTQQTQPRPSESVYGYPPHSTLQPFSQSGYQVMTQPQLGEGPPQTSPSSRPVPKPRTGAAATTTFAQTHTTAVATASDVANGLAALNISSSECFMCTGTEPKISSFSNLCPRHAQEVTRMLQGGYTQQQPNPVPPNSAQLPSHSGGLPNSSQPGPAQLHPQSYMPPQPNSSSASSAHLQTYGSQHQGHSPDNTGNAGGTAYPQPPASSGYLSETVKPKPYSSQLGTHGHPGSPSFARNIFTHDL